MPRARVFVFRDKQNKDGVKPNNHSVNFEGTLSPGLSRCNGRKQRDGGTAVWQGAAVLHCASRDSVVALEARS